MLINRGFESVHKILRLNCIYIHKYKKKNRVVTLPKWEGLKSPPFPFEDVKRRLNSQEDLTEERV